jgi:hypothetical protein
MLYASSAVGQLPSGNYEQQYPFHHLVLSDCPGDSFTTGCSIHQVLCAWVLPCGGAAGVQGPQGSDCTDTNG